MTNDEARMSNDEIPMAVSHSELYRPMDSAYVPTAVDDAVRGQFVIRALSFFRHSDFVIRHSVQSAPYFIDAHTRLNGTAFLN